MINMISSAKFSKIEARADFQGESEEPEKQDFAEILNGFSFTVVPPSAPLPNLPAENSDAQFAEREVALIAVEESRQPLPQFDEGIALPKDFAQVLPKNLFENSDINPAQTIETAKNLFAENAGSSANPAKTESLISEKSEQVPANEKTENSDLFSRLESLEIENASTKKEITNRDFSANQNAAESFADERNPQPASKLPKLFREVSSFLEVSDFSAKFNQTAETAAPMKVSEAEIPTQIEAQIEHLANLAMQTGKPHILKMRLNPAELGAVEIKIEKDAGGNLNAHFQTENEETRQILTDNLAELRDRLEDSGLQLERIEVSCGSFTLAGNETREQSSQAFENAFPFSDSHSKTESNPIVKDEANSEKSNRLLSIRA